jgi:hypothetical protein
VAETPAQNSQNPQNARAGAARVRDRVPGASASARRLGRVKRATAAHLCPEISGAALYGRRPSVAVIAGLAADRSRSLPPGPGACRGPLPPHQEELKNAALELLLEMRLHHHHRHPRPVRSRSGPPRPDSPPGVRARLPAHRAGLHPAPPVIAGHMPGFRTARTCRRRGTRRRDRRRCGSSPCRRTARSSARGRAP